MIPFHLVKLGFEALDQACNGFNMSNVGGEEAKMTRSVSAGEL